MRKTKKQESILFLKGAMLGVVAVIAVGAGLTGSALWKGETIWWTGVNAEFWNMMTGGALMLAMLLVGGFVMWAMWKMDSKILED